MATHKVFIDASEYQRLKDTEQKYVHLKREKKKSDLEGHGSNINADLEKTVLENSNKNDDEISAPGLLGPITVPEPVKDIDGAKPSNEPKRDLSENITEPPQKRRTIKKEEDLPEEWWYLGIPKYT